jgi:glyoxylase-like metal-dependent hydrolase (beta-lactamase superfamily II)
MPRSLNAELPNRNSCRAWVRITSRTGALMRERCATCLASLRRILGEAEMRGTALILPDRLVDGNQSLTVAGRALDLLYFGWGATPGDLVVLDRASGVAFAGGLVSAGRVPSIRDAHVDDWILALDALARRAPAVIVPGYGAVTDVAGLSTTRDYLRALDERVRTLYRNGTGLAEATDHAALPAFQKLDDYAIIHGQNVQRRYLQLEEDELKN